MQSAEYENEDDDEDELGGKDSLVSGGDRTAREAAPLQEVGRGYLKSTHYFPLSGYPWSNCSF